MDNNINFNKYICFLGIVLLFLISYFHLFIVSNNNNNNNNNIHNIIRKRFLFKFKEKLEFFSLNNNNNNNNNNNDDDDDKINKIFPPSTEDKSDENKRSLTRDIYDVSNGTLLLSAKGELRSYPNAEEIPPKCGFGKLYFNTDNESWSCACYEPDYFGGIYCDEPQKKLILKNNCMKVGNINNLKNTDVSTFNPFTHGVCVECATRNAVPNLSSPFPACHTINKIQEEEEEEIKEDKCFRDVVNPNFNSIFNQYIKGYGCVCDYYNGFVEVNVGERGDEDSVDNSNGCLKIGKVETTNHYHKTHIAFHTLQNRGFPKQVHEYRELEQPYQSLLTMKKSVLLIDQPARDVVHKQDWLNRCVNNSAKQKIARLNDGDKWNYVTISGLINYYKLRKYTYPISAYKLDVHKFFVPKKWYETTSGRYVNNAMLGHPIVFGQAMGKLKKWRRKCTLNPLGTREGKYFGLTMLYKPGAIVKLDTRGENEMIVIPPDYKEMIQPNPRRIAELDDEQKEAFSHRQAWKLAH